MAGLAEELAAAHAARRPYQVCTVRKIFDQLEPVDAAALEERLADAAYTATVIADVLTTRGFDVSPYTLGRHRRGRCGCARG